MEGHDMPPPNPGVSAENLKVYWDRKRDSNTDNTPLMKSEDHQEADDKPHLSNTNTVIVEKAKLSSAPNIEYLECHDIIVININI